MSLDQEIQEKSQELFRGMMRSVMLGQRRSYYFYVADKWGRVRGTRPPAKFLGLDSLIQTELKPADDEQ